MKENNNNMVFYEFNNSSYYALIGINRQKYKANYIRVLKYYYNYVSDDGFDSFNDFHGQRGVVPIEITEEQTFNKYIKGCINRNPTVKEAIKNFNNALLEDETLFLVDGALI